MMGVQTINKEPDKDGEQRGKEEENEFVVNTMVGHKLLVQAMDDCSCNATAQLKTRTTMRQTIKIMTKKDSNDNDQRCEKVRKTKMQAG